MSRGTMNVSLPQELINKARAASYWTGEPLSGIVEEGLRDQVSTMEEERGEFPPAKGPLPRGPRKGKV